MGSEGFWPGVIWGLTFGAFFGVVSVGSIWFRHFLRTYKEHYELLRNCNDNNTKLLAITEVLHKQEIATHAQIIEDKTQELHRASGSHSF